jgi:site-specific DNA-methyltransferase (adenine-specific)
VSTGAFVARRNGKVFVTGNSGFPKSLDVSKAIDKAAGAEREVIGQRRQRANNAATSNAPMNASVGEMELITAPATPDARQWNGWGTALKPALEPITMARKPLDGTVAENVLAHGTGAINVDGCRVGVCALDRDTINGKQSKKPTGKTAANVPFVAGVSQPAHPMGRWPANLIHDGSEEVLEGFPDCRPATSRTRRDFKGWKSVGELKPDVVYQDSGSAARFFYCAKADKADRDDGNNHPTVKPVDLMRYLVTLVCREGGTVLDPFMGSGTTGIACIRSGRKFIGIERDASYFEIAKQRLERESRQGLLPFTYPTSGSETNATE